MNKFYQTFSTTFLALALTAYLPLGCGGGDGGGSNTGTTDDVATTTGGDATTTTGGDDTYPASCDVEPTLSSIQANYFNKSCTFSSCHGDGGSLGGLSIDDGESFEALVNVPAVHTGAAQEGKLLVVPGDAESSFLYIKLFGPKPTQGGFMPSGQKEPLGPDCQLRAVRDWINNGALDN